MNNKIDNSYYECKRCFHKFYQKNDMTKHLDKKKLCIRTFESFKYKDEDLYDLSLQRIKLKKFTCTSCDKNFCNNNTLKRHIEKSCKNITLDNSSDINESEVYDIKSDSITISFNDKWDTSHIDDKNKFIMLFTNSRFTKTLEYILKNNVNLNVLIDKTSDYGLVFIDGKFIKMDIDTIVKQTIIKLYEHLTNFHEDLCNIFDIDKHPLNYNFDVINYKFNSFHRLDKDNIIKVNNYIIDIYSKYSDNAVKYINY